VVIAKGPKKTSLEPEFLHIRFGSSIRITACQFFIGCFPKEFIAKGNLIEYPIVHGCDEFVIRIPILLVVILNITVVPGDYGLFGRKLLRLPILSEVGRKSFIDTANIWLTSRTLLTGDSQTSLQFGQHLSV